MFKMAWEIIILFYCFSVVFLCPEAYDLSQGECLTSCTGRVSDTNRRWRDCTNCHNYKICTSSGIETKTCPSDLIWNWKLDTPNCDFDTDGCDDCIRDCNGKEKDTNKRWRHCTNCTKYHKCTTENGLETMTCPGTLKWNYKLDTPNCDDAPEVCDSPSKVCGEDCSFNTDGGLFVLPSCSCCNLYKTCFGTFGVSHNCTTGLVYSPQTKTCANEADIDCGRRTRC